MPQRPIPEYWRQRVKSVLAENDGDVSVRKIFLQIKDEAQQLEKSGEIYQQALAREFAAENINVNAIAPGYMATDNTAALRADEKRNSEILERIPAERWGTPQDVAGPVVFLSSDAAAYVNGYTLAVDGGWLAR